MHSTLIQAPCVHQDPETCPVLESRYACLSLDAMGSRFEFLIDTGGSELSIIDAQAVIEELGDLVIDWHNRLSVFEPTSITSLINRAPAGAAIALDDDMYALCVLCDQLRIRTCGAFNIAAGTLMNAHGFRGDQATHAVSLDALRLEHAITLDHQQRSITRTDDCISIDFGAIAKGFVLDQIRQELKEHGVQNAFVHGGTSSILAIGKDHNALPWTASVSNGYRHSLSGYAAGISEIHSQTRTQGTDAMGHVMDPSTNKPASNSINQIACIHLSAAVADAYSTACCVNPSLLDELSNDPCSLIAFDSSPHPTIHDPLRVVQSQRADHDRS